jgi:hypothetical protein
LVKQSVAQYSQFVFFDLPLNPTFSIFQRIFWSANLCGLYLCVKFPKKSSMPYPISFNKSAVLQALRYHFMKQKDIKTLLIIVNLYAATTAILLFMKKIRPEPFLLGSLLWIVLMLIFWYLLPILFYKKTMLFKQDWEFDFNEREARLVGELGEANWEWDTVTHYFESPIFFHFYFSAKSFFIIPKDTITMEDQHIIRGILKGK